MTENIKKNKMHNLIPFFNLLAIKIVFEVSKLIEDKEYYSNMSKAQNPYGDGKSCKRIVTLIGNK